LAVAANVLVLVAGTFGYLLFGWGVQDAAYQTVTTVTTVGFREVQPLTRAEQLYTMVLILVGVATVLTTFTVVVEALIEGQLGDHFGRRRMEKKVARMSGHVIICGWGRVGRAIAEYVAAAGRELIVVDTDGERLADVPYPTLLGDATDDDVLQRAGVARARTHTSEEKLRRAGADRVVNPQAIGGERMAAFVLQPHVAEFVDVVMHDGSLEFRLEEVPVPAGSPLAGRTIRENHIRDTTGALVLALRLADGTFRTNPDPATTVDAGQILIVIGTSDQLDKLRLLADP
jgi:voltage-gated potassium channel